MVKVFYKVYDRRYDYGYRVDTVTGNYDECIATVRSKKKKLVSPWVTILQNGVAKKSYYSNIFPRELVVKLSERGKMNLYKKVSLIRKLCNMIDFIEFQVHYERLSEEQGEKEVDNMIDRFNQKLLELKRG